MGEAAQTRYRLPAPPATATIEELVATAKLRRRIERDVEELKRKLG